jgi:hypothetical protein
MANPNIGQTRRHGAFAKRRIGLCGESSNLTTDAATFCART